MLCFAIVARCSLFLGLCVNVVCWVLTWLVGVVVVFVVLALLDVWWFALYRWVVHAHWVA